MAMMRQALFPSPTLMQNTTIGVIATNAPLTKTQASKVAQMAHDGLARAIRPVHTPYDGDIVFAMATGSDSAIDKMGVEDLTLIGSLGAEVLSTAVCRAVRTATSLPGFPSHADFLSLDQRG
jgi:L-aminopeptidase/D-esterase-like protein